MQEATVANFATVQNEGDRQVERNIEYYNLDVIIAVGYMVKSHRGTQVRIWANSVLKEYIIKGFAMDDDRLKGNGGGTIGRNCLTASEISDHQKKYSIVKSLIYMRRALTTIPKAKHLFCFSRSFRINCIMQRMVILQRR